MLGKLVYYHASCLDGWCAAWLASLKYPDAELVRAKHGDPRAPLEQVTGRDVLILDFSWPRAALLELKARAASLRVLDHHATAARDLDGLDFCTFDLARSGAGLALDEFFPGSRDGYSKARTLALHIEDRDLWRFALADTKAICTALATVPMTAEAWRDLPTLTDLAHQGAAMLTYETALVQRIAGHAAETRWPEGVLWAVNSSMLQSEVGHAIVTAKGAPALVWYRDSEGLYRCSLRSADALTDVSLWAKTRGGGGHRNAAGFESRTLPI